MNPSALVIADSINEYGDRLTTMEVQMHRFVLAEFNTHRKFSRNSASSRAIPVERQLERVARFPAEPLVWASEQPGMQGGSELEGQDAADARILWDEAHTAIVEIVNHYVRHHPDKSKRLHKSLLNRLLEPFMWHSVIVSSTEWENFFAQRCSPLAQPEIRAVADAMRAALDASQPVLLDVGEWHLPYVFDEDREFVKNLLSDLSDRKTVLQKISVARCARVSYLTHDGEQEIAKDLELFEKLATAEPRHLSPMEHVATPVINRAAGHPGNFDGWHQLRRIYEQ